jgi:enoyl-CoA hydratase
MHLILTGEMISAEEAHRIGLVDEIYPHDDLLTKAMEVAEAICAKAPMAVQTAKECINRGLDVALSVGCDLEKVSFGQMCGTGDKNEGMEAFLEKRKPSFTGH